MNSSMFKSVTNYTISGNTSGKTISGGPGILSISSIHCYNNNYYHRIYIDGSDSPLVIDESDSHGLILFKSSVKISNKDSSTSMSSITVTIGLLN